MTRRLTPAPTSVALRPTFPAWALPTRLQPGSPLLSPRPITSRIGFGGGSFGDSTDLASGSDDAFPALWTDSTNRQTVVWWYGFDFVPTVTNQQDVVTASARF